MTILFPSAKITEQKHLIKSETITDFFMPIPAGSGSSHTQIKATSTVNDPETIFFLAEEILTIICQYQRTDQLNCCAQLRCNCRITAHISLVINYITNNKPIIFTLPGFPCKSPNLNKVLGRIPDYAEILALQFLTELCQKIQKIYPPGARIIICADGRIFADAIGVPDEHISEYQYLMAQLIQQYGKQNLELFTLDQCSFATDAFEMRKQLDTVYGENIAELRAHIKLEPQLMHMYLGLTKFLFEDRLTPDYCGSRTRLQKISRNNAYIVLARSRAWGRLIRELFAESIRLSIHPQNCSSEKLGIIFGETNTNAWYTPWHSVAVLSDSGYRFMQHHQVQKQNYRLVTVDNQPSYFVAD